MLKAMVEAASLQPKSESTKTEETKVKAKSEHVLVLGQQLARMCNLEYNILYRDFLKQVQQVNGCLNYIYVCVRRTQQSGASQNGRQAFLSYQEMLHW